MAGPGRPPNEKDLQQSIAGQPVFLGVLTSTAAVAVNNGTTATKFNQYSTIQPSTGFQGSLAGKVLLLQPTAAGLILPNPTTANPPAPIVVQQATAPSLVAPQSIPGVLIGANERVEITMGQQTAYLDFVAVTGTASLLVWEMT